MNVFNTIFSVYCLDNKINDKLEKNKRYPIIDVDREEYGIKVGTEVVWIPKNNRDCFVYSL